MPEVTGEALHAEMLGILDARLDDACGEMVLLLSGRGMFADPADWSALVETTARRVAALVETRALVGRLAALDGVTV